MSTTEVLNQLLSLHCRSLPMYLQSAPPHRQPGDEKAIEVLSHIVEDQHLMVDRLAELISDLAGIPNRGDFPMEFTDLHDLSLDFIMRTVTERQTEEVALIESLSTQLEAGTQAKALAQEALGACKAHLESLQECLHATA